MKTLMDTLIEAGYPRDQMFHHESDLYVFALWKGLYTWPIILKWYKDNGLSIDDFVLRRFKDLITGKSMYDCAWQYTPWWKERRN